MENFVNFATAGKVQSVAMHTKVQTGIGPLTGSGELSRKPAVHFSFGSGQKPSTSAKGKKCTFLSSYLSEAQRTPAKGLFRVSHT
jgi:hypothetical protein